MAICSIAIKKPRMHFSHRAPLQKRSVKVLTKLIMTSCYGRLLRGGFIFVKLSLSWERSLLNVWQCKVYGAEWEHALRTLSLTVWPQTKTRHSAHLENLSVGRWRETLKKKSVKQALSLSTTQLLVKRKPDELINNNAQHRTLPDYSDGIIVSVLNFLN